MSNSRSSNSNARIVTTYAREDLFSPLNRRGTYFTIGQIALLVLITSGLIVFGGSLKAYTIDKLSDPVINRLNVATNYSQGQTALGHEEFKLMSSLFWTNHPEEGKTVYPLETIVKNGWRKLDAAVVGVRGRHLVTMSVGTMFDVRQASVVSLDPDDPVLEKLGFAGLLGDADEPTIIFKRKTLKNLGYDDVPPVFRSKSFDTEFKVVLDEKGILPYEGVVSEEWYRNYWGHYYSGAPYPPFQKAEVYPRSLMDVVGIAAALDRLGFLFDRSFYLDVKNGQDNINFVSGFVTLLCVILVTIVGVSQFFHFLYTLEKKKKEFGFMMASGVPARVLLSIFLLEGLVICCMGSAIGLGALFLLTPYITTALEVWVDLKGIVYSPMLVLDWLAISIGTIFGMVLLPSLYAVYKNVKARPVQLMRT